VQYLSCSSSNSITMSEQISYVIRLIREIDKRFVWLDTVYIFDVQSYFKLDKVIAVMVWMNQKFKLVHLIFDRFRQARVGSRTFSHHTLNFFSVFLNGNSTTQFLIFSFYYIQKWRAESIYHKKTINSPIVGNCFYGKQVYSGYHGTSIETYRFLFFLIKVKKE